MKEMQLVAVALAKGTNHRGQCHCCVQLQAMLLDIPVTQKQMLQDQTRHPVLCNGLWASPGLSLCPGFQTRPPSGFPEVTWIDAAEQDVGHPSAPHITHTSPALSSQHCLPCMQVF